MVAIISIAAYFIFKKYFSKPTGMDQSTQEAAQQSGIDTTSQKSIFDSVKSQINSIQDAQQRQLDQYSNATAQ